MDSIAVRLKAKEIYGKMLSPLWLVLAGPRISKGDEAWKNVKPVGGVGSAGQNAAEHIFKCLLSVLREKGYVEETIFNTGETGLFYKEVGK